MRSFFYRREWPKELDNAYRTTGRTSAVEQRLAHPGQTKKTLTAESPIQPAHDQTVLCLQKVRQMTDRNRREAAASQFMQADAGVRATALDFLVQVVDRRDAVITNTSLSVFSPEWARECAECLLAAYRRRGGVAARILSHQGEELYRL
jgi:hypothetical protein